MYYLSDIVHWLVMQGFLFVAIYVFPMCENKVINAIVNAKIMLFLETHRYFHVFFGNK